jgi:thymidylate synthase
MFQSFTPYIGEILVGGFTTLITSLIAWFFNRKSKKAALAEKNAELRTKEVEISKLKIETSNQIMKQYQDALNDLENRHEKKCKYLEEEYKRRHQDLKEDYERKIKFLREAQEQRDQANEQKLEQLQKLINDFKQNLELWKAKYRNLKKEFDQYRAKHK